MAYKCSSYPVIEKTAISAGVYSYTILCPEVVELVSSGQFVHVKIEHFTLRRPISICEIDPRRGTLRMVFEVRGEGTKKLSDINVGDNIDMIAPLGHGFTLPNEIPEGKRLLVVGGGIGVPPLLDIARKHKDKVTAIIGYRSYDKVILAGDFKAYGSQVICCTDDGSVGIKGNVCIPLEQELSKGDVHMVYTCGPEMMLKGVIEKTKAHNVKCEVSMEQRMGCGVGACVVCACKIKRGNRDFMLRVCKDGPVFKAEEVAFE